jgi:hypothetical protein
VPVSARLCLKAAAASLLVVAVQGHARAQQMTPQPPAPSSDDAQAPVMQGAPLPPPELRGSEGPGLNDITGQEGGASDSDDLNPVAAPPANYGLPPPVTASGGVTNYGRPKPKKSLLYQLPKIKKVGLKPLPSLRAYATAVAPSLRRKSIADLPADLTDPGPTVAVIPILPQPLRPKADITPFDAVGVRVGSLRLYPYVETATGYDSNPNLLNTDVRASPYIYGETGFKAQSDWSQSSLAADLHGGYYDYLTYHAADQPNAAGTITGRIDVTHQSQINLQTTFSLTEGTPGSPLLSVPNAVFVTSRPLYASVGQTLGFTQQFNRLSVSINSAFARYFFGNATQSNGTIFQLALNDYNAYSLAGRVSYELTPALIPYVQMTGTRNQYESSMDVGGFDRSSVGALAQVGTTYEITRLLTGDISVGYDQRFYADPRLPAARTPTVNASLIYDATPLTTLTFTAATDVGETTLADSSAVIAHTLTLKISHDLLRNLTLAATGTYQINNYVGQPEIDHFYSGLFEADYHMTRSIVITGSYKYQRYTSTAGFTNYIDNVFLAGLKFQL